MVPIARFEAPIDAVVSVPGSKSLTNRALAVSSLAEGKSRLSNVLHSDDTRYMMSHLRTLGLALQASEDQVEIEGGGGEFSPLQASLFCGNAGTTVRFLTALCALVPGTQVVTGDQRMQARPIRDLVDALAGLGVIIEAVDGSPPVTVRSGVLPGGRVQVHAHLSSQYLSGLLMVAPYAQQPVSLEVVGDMVSASYVELTLDVMAAFGVSVERPDARHFNIPQRRYQGRPFAIEGDATSAGYWWALAALTGSRVTVTNVQPSSHQGDIEFLRILERMGCTLTRERGVTVQGPPRLNSPGVVDMNRLPDGVMTLAALAALAQGETRIVNVANLRLKESDRLAALVTELRRIGIAAEELPDGLCIQGGEPHGADIESYADHRMAMSFAILGTRVPGIRIGTPECVSKSYPRFFEQLRALHPSSLPLGEGEGEGNRLRYQTALTPPSRKRRGRAER
jgi:3-phosphoshikimate 1-carboxyvinyltransferase